MPPGAPPAHVAALNRENAARRSKGGRCGDVVIDVGGDDVYVNVAQCPTLPTLTRGARVMYAVMWDDRKCKHYGVGAVDAQWAPIEPNVGGRPRQRKQRGRATHSAATTT